ncbi:hypothetical protein RS130_16560 [Paraglaciecola aquimarina]|uniref:OmpR/PhoB-type domain-containing protein n=1 Tax=Paraglaciecola aquimarina TaxID=1235557 RepID=A0ABU3SZ64_9ALTE|nr:hypothetical protein [Paraglaciecola aquimarina]MDU0355303.1 hypothetical protein [Paraglaciecola aquimarina]
MTDNSYLPSKEDALAQLDLLTSSAIGRSKNQQKLLEYLLERELPVIEGNTADYHAPKEIEIAIDVFGKGENFNPAEDSTVRVNISNLRKKLENYYLQEGSAEKFFITIPVGAYRLTFKKNNDASVQSETETVSPETEQASGQVFNKKSVIGALLFMSVLVNVIAGYFWYKGAPPSFVGQTSKINAKDHDLWSDLRKSDKPVMIVLGDVYNFSEFSKELNRRRTIFDTNIKSDEDLKRYLAEYPEHPNTTLGFRQKLVSKGSTIALKNVFDLVAGKDRVNYRVASDIRAYHLRSFDIIYLGPLNGMGILEQYFQGSHFNLSKHNLQLENKDLSKRYSSPDNMNEGYTDYGLFAKVDGPRNNKIYIFSGFSDPSIMQVSWFMTNEGDLSSKEFESVINQNKLESYNNFEMLFKVPSMDGIDIKHEIIYGGVVDSSVIWASTD